MQIGFRLPLTTLRDEQRRAAIYAYLPNRFRLPRSRRIYATLHNRRPPFAVEI
jgi:hypothetical protein